MNHNQKGKIKRERSRRKTQRELEGKGSPPGSNPTLRNAGIPPAGIPRDHRASLMWIDGLSLKNPFFLLKIPNLSGFPRATSRRKRLHPSPTLTGKRSPAPGLITGLIGGSKNASLGHQSSPGSLTLSSANNWEIKIPLLAASCLQMDFSAALLGILKRRFGRQMGLAGQGKCSHSISAFPARGKFSSCRLRGRGRALGAGFGNCGNGWG